MTENENSEVEVQEELIPGITSPSEKESSLTVEEAENLKDSITWENKAELMKEVAEMSRQHISWRDYCLNLLNTSSEPARSGWREKLVVSINHWSFGKGGAFLEGNLEGLEVLTELPSDLTQKIVDDSYERGTWYFDGRLAGSKKRKILLGHYSQESLAKEGRIMWDWIMDHWFEDWNGTPVNQLVRNSEHLLKVFKFAQKSGGQVISNDEVLTYSLEKEDHTERPAFWTDVAEDVFTNGIPSEKYKKDWKSGKLDVFPAVDYVFDEKLLETETWWNAFLKPSDRVTLMDGKSLSNWTEDEILRSKQGLEGLWKNLRGVLDGYLREDLSNSPSWKRMVVVILQNDLSAKYCGFSPSTKLQVARAEATAAFSKNKKEADKALASVDILKKKAEKEAAK